MIPAVSLAGGALLPAARTSSSADGGQAARFSPDLEKGQSGGRSRGAGKVASPPGLALAAGEGAYIPSFAEDRILTRQAVGAYKGSRL